MLEALWSVGFASNVNDSGAGVVVLETGRILGGDSSYLYVGNYRVENGEILADVKVTHYAGQPSSVFGPAKEFNLSLKGVPDKVQFDMVGHVVENPTLKILIQFIRRAELP